MRRSAKLRALHDIARVHAPLCLIHVKNDWLVSHAHSVALYEAANEPKELHVIDIEGNYHADRIFSVASAQVDPNVQLLPWLEREFTLHAMKTTRGNQVRAAKLLGITRATLRKRLERFNITKELTIS